uniref:Reverse transcriptase domain-containing protein n=1 Tax=Oryzias latipes TaxID=8090 RepID=A0A3P9MG11_ORYLA
MINSTYEHIKTAYQQSAKECLGFRTKKGSKEWIKQKTWKAIEDRRNLKNQLLNTHSERLQTKYKQQYREANKTVKRMVRADRRAYIEELAEEAERATTRGEQGQLYRISRQVCGKHHSTVSLPIKDKQGKLLTTEAEQDTRWAEHFQEVLNRDPPTEGADIPEGKTDLDINTDPPTKEEIVSVIKSLKSNKAPGHDNLNAELFKTDTETASKILQPFFKTVWISASIPEEWTKGVIIKIPKKGTLSECNNWRGITLLSIPSKIMAKIIINRLSEAVNAILRKEQAGFRKGRRCTEQIFALRNIIEQSAEWQQQLSVNFIDFEKAFDSVHRDSLWRILRAYGVPTHMIKLIRSFYNNYRCCVGGSDIWFEVKTGVRQGCVMSALLFNVVIDWVMRRTTEAGPTGIRWTLFST